jgi:hypothetical protein
MPTATDLVTDLPADFEVFGQAVATSMQDLLGGTTGQVLAKASNTNMDFSWVTTDDANAIQNSIVDAKGDIVAASANDTPARLAVGSNNYFLRANSAAATGLEWAGDYTAWTPTFGNFTLGNGTLTARYIKIGKFVHAYFNVTMGSTSVMGSNPNFTVPFTAQLGPYNMPAFASLEDTGVSIASANAVFVSTTTMEIGTIITSSATASLGIITATNPFTWGTGDRFWANIIYEAAV